MELHVETPGGTTRFSYAVSDDADDGRYLNRPKAWTDRIIQLTERLRRIGAYCTDIRIQSEHREGEAIRRMTGAKYRYARVRSVRERQTYLREAPPCELQDRLLQAERYGVL